jgi:hypothetical protein
MDKFQEALLVALVNMSDEGLRALITAALADQRRRMKSTVVKCRERTTHGLPNVILRDLDNKLNK